MEPLAELLGASPGIVALREKLLRLLRASDARRLPPILLEGETGTGKGLLARAVHGASARRDGPFVDVNCPGIPETLLEAEMFGFERGAFTDARHAKPGLMHLAHRGTIFLDEIGLLPESLQAKLLKVIEERAVRRLGATQAEPVDVWVLAATNEDLTAATRERRFREDLYHRLAVVVLTLPPLRERGEDIILLAEHFLARAASDYGLAPKSLDAGARAALRAYHWPGNVRELANTMERVALLADASVITADVLAPSLAAAPSRPAAAPPTETPLDEAIRDVEREHLLQALQATGWNISRAAARLGISRNTARYRMERHGLRREAAAAPTPRPAPPVAGPPVAPSATPSPATSPAPSPAPSVVRWERRRIALLGAMVAEPAVTLEGGRAIEFLVDKVQSFGGRVEELGATAMVAAFGLEPVEDAPRRAANAAMAIQIAAQRAQAGSPDALRLKSAIHVTEVLVGRVDGGTVLDEDARRQAWRVLQELAARTTPGSITVSESAAIWLGRRFDLVPAAEAGGPPLLRLAGAERATPATAGGLSAFVGRQHDLQLLEGLLESAERGQGQVVGITGEAGIGKSRLLFELRQRAARRSVSYLEGQSRSYGGAIPYLPLIDILRTACQVTEETGSRRITELVHAALLAAGMEAEDAAPYLLRLLGVSEGAEATSAQPPEAIKARTFERLRELLIRRSPDTPLILAVEDLHWVDRTSEEFLATLVEAVAGARILLIATYRPGFRPSWLDKSYASQIALQPLPPPEAQAVLRSVLGEGPISETVMARILDKAEGNPFFLEELARTVREQRDQSTLEVPDTVEDVVLARVDRLPLEDKRLLQIGAVVGKDVSRPVLEAVADLPGPALEEGLQRLAAGEFWHVSRTTPEPQYTFHHALSHEVVYASLLPEQRRDLHRRILEAIERQADEGRSEHPETLAHHAMRGEVWDRAVDYLREAGVLAFAKGSMEESLESYERALDIASRLPLSPDNTRRMIDVRLDLHAPLIVRAQVGRLIELHREAEGYARALNDVPRLGRAFYRMGQYSWMEARYQDGVEYCRQALELARTIDDAELEVIATYVFAVNRYSTGAYRTAIELFLNVLEGPAADLARRRRLGLMAPPYILGCGWVGLCFAFTGDFERAMHFSRRAVEAADALDYPQAQAIAYTLRALAVAYRGEFAEALTWGQRAVHLCETKGLLVLFPGASSALGWALAGVGRSAEALPYVERGAEFFEHLAVKTHLSQQYVRWGEGLLMAGHLDEARRVAERAIELAVAVGEQGFEVEGRLLRARIRSAQKPLDLDGARRDFGEARTLAETLGMRLMLARCALGLGQLLGAPELLGRARDLFREMDAPFWLDEAQAALSTSAQEH